MKYLYIISALCLLNIACNNSPKSKKDLIIGKWESTSHISDDGRKITLTFSKDGAYSKEDGAMMAGFKNPIVNTYSGTYTLTEDLNSIHTTWGDKIVSFKSVEHIDSLSESMLVLSDAKLNRTITYANVKVK
jgi:hypothetical protein